MVKVMPKNNDMRKMLKHPLGNIPFSDVGPTEWPNDSFTARRIRDGDVIVVEEHPTSRAPRASDIKKGE